MGNLLNQQHANKVYIITDTCFHKIAFTSLNKDQAYRFAAEHAIGKHTGTMNSTIVSEIPLDEIQEVDTSIEEVSLETHESIREFLNANLFTDLMPENDENQKGHQQFLEHISSSAAPRLSRYY